jgi:polysaccharide biosynthesis protein PslH
MRPNLLFIAARRPAITGGGAAMRTAMVLEALAERYRIFLLVVPVYGRAAPPDADLAGLCAEVVLAAAPAVGCPLTDPAAVFPGVRFEAVHVDRIGVAPVANAYLREDGPERPALSLDTADFESGTHLRIARLHEENGDGKNAEEELEMAGYFAELERHYLPLFDRVYVCSEMDRQRIECYDGAPAVRVVPNAIRLPRVIPERPANPFFTLLYVGNMGYYPNEDAVTFFCRDILPKLRRRAASAVRLLVVGRGPSSKLLAACGAGDGVSVVGEVPDPDPYYAEADAVIAPIRAGGGTRIKILEGCSYRRPVVSTAMGAEGLTAAPGREILLADTPDEFADACWLLMRDPGAACRIAAAGCQWVQSNHTADNVRMALGVDG